MLESRSTKTRPVSAPATSTLFHQILAAQGGESEEQFDDRLRGTASQLGLDTDSTSDFSDRRQSINTCSSICVRRSISPESCVSQSTGLTSNSSTYSPEGQPRASLSFHDYDAFLARGTSNGRHSISFAAAPHSANSVLSLPLSQPASRAASPKRTFGRLAGLGLLKIHRRGASTSPLAACPHCPLDTASQRRAVHLLKCGHRLCTQALRNTVRAAIDHPGGAVPSCCGIPISGRVVENVMTGPEQIALLAKLELWDECISIPLCIADDDPSLPSSRSDPLSCSSRPLSDELGDGSVDAKLLKDIETIVRRTDFKILHRQQLEQRDDLLHEYEQQKAPVLANFSRLRERQHAQHESALRDLVDRHDDAMAEAEDRQVMAEADLRCAHAQEKRDSATALKHMEAYCAGVYSSDGEPHNRTVTDQDRAELDKARHERGSMEIRHQNAINVLRGEQSRRVRLRDQRQTTEVQSLKREQELEAAELERSLTSELTDLEQVMLAKRSRCQWRWELQTAIYLKTIETETSVPQGCRLPGVDWGPRRDSVLATPVMG